MSMQAGRSFGIALGSWPRMKTKSSLSLCTTSAAEIGDVDVACTFLCEKNFPALSGGSAPEKKIRGPPSQTYEKDMKILSRPVRRTQVCRFFSRGRSGGPRSAIFFSRFGPGTTLDDFFWHKLVLRSSHVDTFQMVVSPAVHPWFGWLLCSKIGCLCPAVVACHRFFGPPSKNCNRQPCSTGGQLRLSAQLVQARCHC